MNSITIDCDTQTGQMIDVATGDVVTVTGSHFGLPEWLESGTGTVPDFGEWTIYTQNGQITLDNPMPMEESEPQLISTMHFDCGDVNSISVFQNAFNEIRLPSVSEFGKTFKGWEINGVVYDKTYKLISDVNAKAVFL